MLRDTVQKMKQAVDECIAAVNATQVIPHPTVDDNPKCVACKTAVALHMEMPTNLIKDKRYELDYCNTHACLSRKRMVGFLSAIQQVVDVRLHDSGIVLIVNRAIQ